MRLKQLTRTLTLSTILALTTFSGAAYAGKHEQAVEAIAQARGKIDAGDRVGTSSQSPELQAQARAALSNAENLLVRGKKSEAIIAAQHAGELADQAIVSADNRKMSAERDRRLDAQAFAMDAQRSVGAANDRADSAQQAVLNANVRAETAQQQAALANNRADSAQRETQAANAQTQALLNTPQPAPKTTVAIVEREVVRTPAAPVRRVRHRVIHRHHAVTSVRRTTTVTTTTP